MRIFHYLLMLVPLAASSAAAETPAQTEMRAVMAFCNNQGDLNPGEVELTLHTVRSGQNMGTIARDHAVDGTGGRCLWRLNEEVLAPIVNERCADLQRNENDGFYCNDSLANANYPAWSSSLRPGDEIYIISGLANSGSGLSGNIVREVNVAAAAVEGDDIVLVIDVSGSMNDESDRAMAAALYSHLLGDRLQGVVFYSKFAHFVPTEQLDTSDIFASQHAGDTGNGSDEYVHRALQLAAASGADAIVLVADERGVDTSGISFTGLPAVTAHCLPDPNQAPCFDMFRTIATQTGGNAPGSS